MKSDKNRSAKISAIGVICVALSMAPGRAQSLLPATVSGSVDDANGLAFVYQAENLGIGAMNQAELAGVEKNNGTASDVAGVYTAVAGDNAGYAPIHNDISAVVNIPLPIPEPSFSLLWLAGLGSLFWYLRRRSRRDVVNPQMRAIPVRARRGRR